jgi:hypothetical protein
MKAEVTRLLDLERRIMLKEANPLWSASDIEVKVSELERAEEEKLSALEMDSLLVASLDELSPGKSIDDEAMNDYRGRVKKSLREIFFLLHPHRLAHHPGFEKLTKDQREHLRLLWENVMEIKQVDLRYPEGTVGRSLHSLEKLAGIRDTARKILEHSGLDVNVDYIIIGETIEERIAWLNREIGQLEGDVQHIKSDIILLSNDEDVLEKKAIVASPAKYEQVKSEMIARTEAVKKEADSLESKLALLFGSGA